MLKELLQNDIRNYTKKYSFGTIKTNCAQFLSESNGIPLYKELSLTPVTEVSKIKLRHKKKESDVSNAVNEALAPKLLERALFAQTSIPNNNPFYVFPINNYKYVFTEQIGSFNNYTQIYEQLSENEITSNQAHALVCDLLKLSFTNNNLFEHQSTFEVLMYDIPYYYAVNANLYPDYNKLLQKIQESV